MNIAHDKEYLKRINKTGQAYVERFVQEPQHSECLTKGDLWAFVRTMLPPWMVPAEYFCVTVNRNVCCAKHRDRGNLSSNGVMFLGTFTGGALLDRRTL